MVFVPNGFITLAQFVSEIGLQTFGEAWRGDKQAEINQALAAIPGALSKAPPPIRPIDHDSGPLPAPSIKTSHTRDPEVARRLWAIVTSRKAAPSDANQSADQKRRKLLADLSSAESQWDRCVQTARQRLIGTPPDFTDAQTALIFDEQTGSQVTIPRETWRGDKAVETIFRTGRYLALLNVGECTYRAEGSVLLPQGSEQVAVLNNLPRQPLSAQAEAIAVPSIVSQKSPIQIAYEARVAEFHARGAEPPYKRTKSGIEGDREWAKRCNYPREEVLALRRKLEVGRRVGAPSKNSGIAQE